MFFYISNLDSLPTDKKLVLTQLLLAHWNGYHYIWCSKKDLEYLESNYQGREEILPIIIKLKEMVNEGKSLMSTLNFYIKLDFQDIDPYRFDLKKKEEQCSLSVGYKQIQQIEYESKICLISENLTDIQVYKFLAQEYLLEEWLLKNLSLSIEGISGGGSQTARSFNNSKKDRITLCLVDSDQKYYKAAIKSTARDVCNTIVRHGEIAKAHILKCHEVENLLPPSVWKIWKEKKQDTKSDLGKLFDDYRFVDSQNRIRKDFVRYIDYKSGLCWDVISAETNPAFKEYWKKFPLQGHEEQKKQGRRCICIPFNNNALKDFMDDLDQDMNLREEVKEVLHSEENWYILWKKYARTICSWAIAARRTIAS